MSIVESTRVAPQPRTRRVFPLNLSPFEDYMVWDDRPEYPMTYVIQMEFAGALDREAITTALPLALQRHPLYQAVIRPAKGGRDGWVAAPDPTVTIQWGDLDAPIELKHGEAIDIRNEVGLRIWIRADDDHAVITMQCHHAVSDGIGSYQFISDWLWFYAAEIGLPIQEELPPLEPHALRDRIRNSYIVENYHDEAGKFDSRPTKSLGWQCIKGVQPLSAPKGAKCRSVTGTTQTIDFPGLCSFEFDAKLYREIRRIAEQRGQTTNELLTERLLVTMRQWNEENGQSGRRDLCIMMPMDLRELETRMATAANMVTYALIRRKQSQCIASEELIDSLRQEMLHLKHQRQRTPFMNMISYIQRFPTGLKKWVSSQRCMATAILSNTGDPTKRFLVPFPRVKGLLTAGNLTLTDIRGVPPMRSGTRLTISIFTYRRVLKICLRCDPHLFDQNDTKRFADAYQKSIESLLETFS